MKKLLLDECIPHKIRLSFTEFDVYTVTFMGWSGVKNGKLLQLACDNGFDIFLATDKKLFRIKKINTCSHKGTKDTKLFLKE